MPRAFLMTNSKVYTRANKLRKASFSAGNAKVLLRAEKLSRYAYDASDVISPAKQVAGAHLPKEGAATGNAGRDMSLSESITRVN